MPNNEKVGNMSFFFQNKNEKLVEYIFTLIYGSKFKIHKVVDDKSNF